MFLALNWRSTNRPHNYDDVMPEEDLDGEVHSNVAETIVVALGDGGILSSPQKW